MRQENSHRPDSVGREGSCNVIRINSYTGVSISSLEWDSKGGQRPHIVIGCLPGGPHTASPAALLV